MRSQGVLIIIAFIALLWSSVTLVSGSPYSVAVRTNRDAYVVGEYVEISGSVTDQGNRSVSTFIEITILTPENASLLVDVTHSNSEGYFYMLLALPLNASLGTYLVTATAEGPASYTTFKVVLNSITCLVNNSFAYPDTPILVYGCAYPARRAEVSLEFSKDDKDWKTIANIYTNSSGHYSYSWTAPSEGRNYSIRASLDGATSPAARLKVVVKEQTMISFSLSSYVTYVGKSVRLDGVLNSTSRNATITIQYEDPEGASVNHTVQADTEGLFKDTFQPDKEGTWVITASWPGNALNLRATSMEVQLSVGPPPPTVLFLSVVAAEDIIVLSLLARRMYIKRKARRH